MVNDFWFGSEESRSVLLDLQLIHLQVQALMMVNL